MILLGGYDPPLEADSSGDGGSIDDSVKPQHNESGYWYRGDQFGDGTMNSLGGGDGEGRGACDHPKENMDYADITFQQIVVNAALQITWRKH